MKTVEARDAISLCYGSPLGLISQSLRGFLIPQEGYEFMSMDFSSIEARVTAWLAGDQKELSIFRDKKDIYRHTAALIFGIPYSEVTPEQRQIGKVAILSLGFGGGVGAFQQMAKNYLVKVPDKMAESIKVAWRESHPLIVSYWHQLERAAMGAIQSPGQTFKAGLISYKKAGSFLWCQLPSTRVICYPYPKIEGVLTPWGEIRDQITAKAVDPDTREWASQKVWYGKLVENCCTGDTCVLTSRGWIPIRYVSVADKVYDGKEWVSHDGVIDQGAQEIGEWLGVGITGAHLVLAGEKWQSATAMDDSATHLALKLMRDLDLSSLKKQELETRSFQESTTPETEGQQSLLLSKETASLFLNSGSSSVLSGKAETLLPTTCKWERHTNKSWITTEKREQVFDLKNCGPRHRFVIRTCEGPVIIHNCVQATARDFLTDAMLRVEEKGFPIVMHCHDEIVAEVKIGTKSLEEMSEIVSQNPSWAPGIPLEAKGWRDFRYKKA
jgi:hypothetical protein